MNMGLELSSHSVYCIIQEHEFRGEQSIPSSATYQLYELEQVFNTLSHGCPHYYTLVQAIVIFHLSLLLDFSGTPWQPASPLTLTDHGALPNLVPASPWPHPVPLSSTSLGLGLMFFLQLLELMKFSVHSNYSVHLECSFWPLFFTGLSSTHSSTLNSKVHSPRVFSIFQPGYAHWPYSSTVPCTFPYCSSRLVFYSVFILT